MMTMKMLALGAVAATSDIQAASLIEAEIAARTTAHPILDSTNKQNTKEEVQALQTLTKSSKCRPSNPSAFINIIQIMPPLSQSSLVQNLSLIHDPSLQVLDECANTCGFEVIVSAIGNLSDNAMAQTNACKVLFIVSAAKSKQGEYHQIAIRNADGLEALGDAMRSFTEDMIVVEGCLLAFSNLCIPYENLHILDGNLIELTVEIMSKSEDNCGIQEHGCACLANLAVHNEVRERIL